MKKILSLACAACVLLCLCSCAPAGHQIPTKPTEIWDTNFPLSVTDSYGNTVVIESEPKRIVSCAPNITELIFELGAGEKVVGRTDYCNYPAEVSDIPSIGAIDVPSIEAIVALKPDLVIASSIFTESSYDALTELGIPVVVIHEEYDLDGVKTMIQTVAGIVNQFFGGVVLNFQMSEIINTATEPIEGKERPTVYYAVSFGEYGDYTAGGDTFVHQLIETAGGDNIAADITGWSFSVEKLIEADPDVILVNQYMLDEFLATEPYSGLSAVQNGRVYGVDSDLLERQGFRNALGIKNLVSLLYPEVQPIAGGEE